MPTLYCRHIKVNGRRCLSPAMRGRALCYFHTRVNERHRSLQPPAPPVLEGETILHPVTVGPGELQRDPQRDPQRDSQRDSQHDSRLAESFASPPVTPANTALSLPALEDRESIQVALSVALQALAQNRIDPKRAYALLFGLQVASRNAQNLNLDSERVVVDTTEDEAGDELAPDEDPIEIRQTEAILSHYDLGEDDESDDDDSDEDEDG